MSKNKKIVYGIIALFVIVAGVFIWNNYQIEISERPMKPLKPPAIISGECGIEQCHGLDITCGPNIPEGCTMEARIDDFCRQYARCEKVGRKCRLIKEPKFEECKSCIEKCNQEEDPEKAFQCASRCEGTAGKEMPFESIVKNDGMTNSYDESPKEFVFAVVTEEKKFIELWKKMHPSDEQLPPWPWADFMVDFKRDDVVVVMSDKKGSLCCPVEITKIYLLDNQNLLIEVEETQSGRGCNVSAVETRPYHLVRIAKTSYQKIEHKVTVVQNPPCD